MMRRIVAAFLLLAACTGGAAPPPDAASVRLHDDLAAYAAASCLAMQDNAYLRDQGQRWAGAVMQNAHGPVERWGPVAEAVKVELRRSGIAQGQGEGPNAATIPLPVMTCGTIAATPSVRTAISAAAKALAADDAAIAR